MAIDSNRIKIIHDEVDRYMGQHKISMEEVFLGISQIYEEWSAKGCPEPDFETRDNYGQFFCKPTT
jgi:hypothetical protein